MHLLCSDIYIVILQNAIEDKTLLILRMCNFQSSSVHLA